MKYEVTNAQYVHYLEQALASGDISVSWYWVVGYWDGNQYFEPGA